MDGMDGQHTVDDTDIMGGVTLISAGITANLPAGSPRQKEGVCP